MLKRFFKILGLIVIALILIVAGILVKPDVLRPVIIKSAKKFAGYDIHLGTLKTHRNPLRIEVADLEIRNPAWPDPILLNLGSLDLELLNSPFSEEPFWALTLDGLTVNATRSKSGDFNWLTPQLTAQAQDEAIEVEEPESEPGPILPKDFNFRGVTLRNIVLNWRDADAPLQTLTLKEIDGKRILTAQGELNVRVNYHAQDVGLSGTVTLFDPVQGIIDYRLSLQQQDLNLESSGRIILSSDLAGSEIALALHLTGTESLNSLLVDTDTVLPPLPDSEISAKLAITPDYQLELEKLRIGENQLKGRIESNTTFDKLTATLEAGALDIDALLVALQGETEATEDTPADAPQAVAQEATTDTDQTEDEFDWAWLSRRMTLNFTGTTVAASGWQVDGLKLTAKTGEALTLDASTTRIEELATQRVIGPLTSQLSLKPLATATTGADADLSLKLQQADITLTAEGPVNLNGNAGSELQLSLTSPRSTDLWQIAQLDWQEAGALNLKSTFKSGDDIRLHLDANLGTQSAIADLAIALAAIPEIRGEITLRKVDLNFMSPADTETSKKPDETSEPTKDTRVISNDALPLDALRQTNGNLTIKLIDIDTGYSRIQNAEFKPQLQGGRFELSDSTIRFDNGNAELSSIFDASGDTATLQLNLSLDSDNYGALGLEKSAGITGGTGGLRLNLQGKGNSPAEIASQLNGQIDMKVRDLRAQGNALDLISSDVLTETINKINPFAEAKEFTDIECVAVHFKGDKGEFISKQGLAVETEASKILGTGSLDLKREKLQFSISPIARKGVGVNIGAAASLVRLGGSFSKPRVEVDPSGVLSSGLSTGAAIYTGGLSILAQGLLKRALYAGSACDGELQDNPELETLPEQLPLPEPETPSTEPGTAPLPANQAG